LKLSVRKTVASEEQRQIVNLLVDSFPGRPKEMEEMFSLMLKAHPELTAVLVENDDAKIVSVLFLITGKFIHTSKQFTYCNMSYFVTDTYYRKGQATALIIDYVTEVIQNTYDLVIGFPRHLMQGYWTRHRFEELTNSKCTAINVKKADLPRSKGTTFRVATPTDIAGLNMIYCLTSSKRVINFIRSISRWEYLLRVSRLHKLQIFICEDPLGDKLGYFVIRDGVILEVGCIDGREYQVITQELLTSLGLSDISISLRGALPNPQNITQKLLDGLGKIALIGEDLWDFMYFCRDENLKQHFRQIEGSTHFDFNSTSPSNFTLLDQF